MADRVAMGGPPPLLPPSGPLFIRWITVAGAPHFGQLNGFGIPCGTSIVCPQLPHWNSFIGRQAGG